MIARTPRSRAVGYSILPFLFLPFAFFPQTKNGSGRCSTGVCFFRGVESTEGRQLTDRSLILARRIVSSLSTSSPSFSIFTVRYREREPPPPPPWATNNHLRVVSPRSCENCAAHDVDGVSAYVRPEHRSNGGRLLHVPYVHAVVLSMIVRNPKRRGKV